MRGAAGSANLSPFFEICFFEFGGTSQDLDGHVHLEALALVAVNLMRINKYTTNAYPIDLAKLTATKEIRLLVAEIVLVDEPSGLLVAHHASDQPSWRESGGYE